MHTFNKVQSTIQEVIESMANILNLDIEIIDTSLTRVCATGKLKKMIGEKVALHGMVSGLINNKKDTKITVMNPGKEECCKTCNMNTSCLYKKAIYKTITYENEIIGILGIVSFDTDETQFMKHNEATMLEFLDKVNNFICINIHKNEVVEQINSVNKIIGHLMNDVDLGIIILDRTLKIQDINEFCEKKLYIRKDEYINKHLKTVFSDIDITTLNKQSNKITWRGRTLKYQIKQIRDEYKITEKIILYIKYSDDKINEAIQVSDIIGKESTFLKFKEKVIQVAATDSTTLLMGETGTGKELFARLIQKNSMRADKPLVVINCSAIPESLIESTLFGYEKGAFTGASSTGKDGKFIMAHQGTVFLDEVEAIPLYMQTKLLRVLENKTIEKVGGIKEIPIDIRIIGATNVSLEMLVEQGKFREDLYHRLNVITLVIPPLRERGNDILLLADYFIKMFSSRIGKDIKGINEETKNIFLNYSWKGNVRELKNAIEYAVIMEQSEYIRKDSLPHQISVLKVKNDNIKSIAEIEKEQIIKALTIHGSSNEGKIKAADVLGISRSTLYRKLKEYSLV